MNREIIGLRIRKLREDRGYTREQLAEVSNLSSKFIYEIESGKKGFSAETLVKFRNVFCVSCDYIMLGEAGDRGVVL